MKAGPLVRSIQSRLRRHRIKLVVLALAVAVGVGGWIASRDPNSDWPDRVVLNNVQGHALGFTPDGRTFLTEEEDGITPWDVATGRRGKPWQSETDECDHWQWTMSPDCRTFARVVIFGFDETRVELVDAITGRSKAVIPTRLPRVYSLAFTPDSRTLRVFQGGLPANAEVEMVTYNAETGAEQCHMPRDSFEWGDLWVISEDGRLLAMIGDVPGPMELRELETGREAGRLTWPEGSESLKIETSAISPDGRLLAIGIEGGSVATWDIPTRGWLKLLPVHSSKGWEPGGIHLSPGGRILVSTRWRNYTPSMLDDSVAAVRKWLGFGSGPQYGFETETILMDVASGRKIGKFRPSPDPPLFSPDGRTFATPSYPSRIRLRAVPDPPR